MRRLFILVFFLISLYVSGLTNTTISGELPGGGGKKIKFGRICGLVSPWTIPLAETTLDPEGHFSVQLVVSQTFLCVISIDFHKTQIFIEPGKNYQLRLTQLTEQEGGEINPFNQSQSLELTFVNQDTTGINYAISCFDSIFDAFVLKHFNEIYRERNKGLIDTLRNQVSHRFMHDTDLFFDNYCLYQIATLEQAAMAGSQASLAGKYFIGKPILYNNPAYMDFFQSFFTKFLTVTSRDLRRTDYKALLHGNEAYSALMKVLGTDTMLRNEQLREMVLMQGILEFFHSPGFSPEENLKVLKTLQQKSRFSDNNLLAWDLIQCLTWLKPGSPAPGFSLIDLDKKTFSLKDFNGKPVLLCFWTTGCQACLSAMEQLQPVIDKNHDKIYFVAISADKEFLTMQYFLKQKKSLTWKFLHVGNSTDVLLEYDARSYPLFVLIDKNGCIISCPAETPGNGLENELQEVLGN